MAQPSLQVGTSSLGEKGRDGKGEARAKRMNWTEDRRDHERTKARLNMRKNDDGLFFEPPPRPAQGTNVSSGSMRRSSQDHRHGNARLQAKKMNRTSATGEVTRRAELLLSILAVTWYEYQYFLLCFVLSRFCQRGVLHAAQLVGFAASQLAFFFFSKN